MKIWLKAGLSNSYFQSTQPLKNAFKVKLSKACQDVKTWLNSLVCKLYLAVETRVSRVKTQVHWTNKIRYKLGTMKDSSPYFWDWVPSSKDFLEAAQSINDLIPRKILVLKTTRAMSGNTQVRRSLVQLV